MKKHPFAAAGAVIAVVAALGGFLVARPAHASRVSAQAAAQVGSVGGLDETDVIAQHGFGDRQNSYAWAMGWFKGKLYVGTGRNVACVENETVNFYFPFTRDYYATRFPGVTCAKNPFDLDERAEIWQYTPTTGRWLMVYRAQDTLRNPRARGKWISPAIAFRDISVATAPNGQQAMFASGVSADEYIPELAARHPPLMLRTYDGVHWTNITTPFIVRKSGQFSDHRPIGFRGIVQFKHNLYALASTALTGDGQIFRVDNAWSGDRAHFVQVTPRWMDIFELEKYDGDLYVGGASYTSGYYVYKSPGTGRAPYHFKAVVTGGGGRGKFITSVLGMHAYRGWLYVSAVGWYCSDCGTVPLTEMIRINPLGKWQVVVGNARRYQGQMKYPISGIEDNFENIFNSHIWRLDSTGGALYAGTNDWSWLMQNDKTAFKNGNADLHGIIQSLLAGETGFDIWATCDGISFFPVTRTAFGVDFYDFGARNIVGVNGGFYIGSADHSHGTRIFWTPHTVCSSGVGTNRAQAARGALPAPQALMTDVQRQGTVLSWERSRFATQYTVMRAPYVQVPLTYQDPSVLPGGGMFDDTVPVPAAQGAPDTANVNLTTPAPYQSIGTTANAYFVDRTAKLGVRYAYEIVATNQFGAQSTPSNVQTVPDPRPPATFGQLTSLLGMHMPTFASDAASRWRSGQRTATVADLRRLAGSSSNDDVSLLAQRLARRLQYWDVAGGPVGG